MHIHRHNGVFLWCVRVVVCCWTACLIGWMSYISRLFSCCLPSVLVFCLDWFVGTFNLVSLLEFWLNVDCCIWFVLLLCLVSFKVVWLFWNVLFDSGGVSQQNVWWPQVIDDAKLASHILLIHDFVCLFFCISISTCYRSAYRVSKSWDSFHIMLFISILYIGNVTI